MEWVALRRIFLLLVLGTACTSEMQAPATPEEIIRKYQRHIDQNEHNAAIALSTPSEQKRLEEEARIIALAPPDSTVFHTRFNYLQCRETDSKTAICSCSMEDEYGAYEGLFRLVKINGEWRVDVPVEDLPSETPQLQNR